MKEIITFSLCVVNNQTHFNSKKGRGGQQRMAAPSHHSLCPAGQLSLMRCDDDDDDGDGRSEKGWSKEGAGGNKREREKNQSHSWSRTDASWVHGLASRSFLLEKFFWNFANLAWSALKKRTLKAKASGLVGKRWGLQWEDLFPVTSWPLTSRFVLVSSLISPIPVYEMEHKELT